MLLIDFYGYKIVGINVQYNEANHALYLLNDPIISLLLFVREFKQLCNTNAIFKIYTCKFNLIFFCRKNPLLSECIVVTGRWWI